MQRKGLPLSMQVGHLIICYVIEEGELELLRQQPLLKLCNVVPLVIDFLLMSLSHFWSIT
jgi:hypothetical protein